MSINNASHNSMNESTLIQAAPSAFKLRSMNNEQEFMLDQTEVLVGREVECQIALVSGHISRYHAKITVLPTEVVIEDLRSTNGTFINGRRITSPQTAHLGDEIRFHEQAFRLVSSEEHSGQQDATVFQQAPNPENAFDELPDPQPAPPDAVAEPQDQGDDTRLLSTEDLNRLQGRAEQRSTNSVDHGSGPRMVVMTAPIRGKVFSLISSDTNAWLLGRSQECVFQLQDQTVSAEHARIRRLGEEWVLEACEGRNPIFINNRSVEFSTLNPGDVVRIGRMELVFRVDEKSLVEPEEEKAHLSKLNVGLLLGALVMLGLVMGLLFA